MQSDQRYAEAYVYMRTQKGFGPLRIQAELRQRGVAAGIIHAVIDQDDEFWLTQLKKFVKKNSVQAFPVTLRPKLAKCDFCKCGALAVSKLNTCYG